MRRFEGVKKHSALLVLEALEGDLVRFPDGDAVFCGFLSSRVGRSLTGVTTELDDMGSRDRLFDGVEVEEEGVRRSNRPRTWPFLWGVGPMDLRCATGLFWAVSKAFCGSTSLLGGE